ncbi:unnamed protein product [Effrenium voratum]|nr:unnamed protein product [Effrenium voratum]
MDVRISLAAIVNMGLKARFHIWKQIGSKLEARLGFRSLSFMSWSSDSLSQLLQPSAAPKPTGASRSPGACYDSGCVCKRLKPCVRWWIPVTVSVTVSHAESCF